MLTAFCQKEDRKDWDEALPFVMMAYRSTPQESTGLTPNMLMLGREVRTPTDLQYPPPEGDHEYECHTEYAEWVRSVQREAHELARTHLQAAAQRQKRNYDLGSRAYDIQVGNWVYVRDYAHKKTKLHFRWKGPYLVIAQKSPVTFQVQLTVDTNPIVHHVDSLKRCYGCTQPKWTWQHTQSVAVQTDSPTNSAPAAEGENPRGEKRD